jgi:hypothetical protein
MFTRDELETINECVEFHRTACEDIDGKDDSHVMTLNDLHEKLDDLLRLYDAWAKGEKP